MHTIRENFEFDYWGVSNKQSLKHILNVDLSASIDFAEKSHPGIINLQILLPKEKSRINILSKEEATYFMTNFRFHPKDY